MGEKLGNLQAALLYSLIRELKCVWRRLGLIQCTGSRRTKEALPGGCGLLLAVLDVL